MSLPGVAKWLLRQESADEFAAAWLNSATEATTSTETAGGPPVVTFDSTLELSGASASERFTGGPLALDEKRRDDRGGP